MKILTNISRDIWIQDLGYKSVRQRQFELDGSIAPIPVSQDSLTLNNRGERERERERMGENVSYSRPEKH